MLYEIAELFSTVHHDLPSVEQLILVLAMMSVYGLIVSTTYWFSDKDRVPSQGYALTLVMIPPVVAAIIMMVGTNLASALSLGGALAIIRFRSVPSDPKDVAYVLFCTAIGLAGGRGLLLYALCITLVLCLVMLALQHFRYAAPKRTQKRLKITIPENFNHQNAFDDIFAKYSSKAEPRRIRTTDLGSLFEISYNITMPDDADEKAFLDEIRARNGNLPVILSMADTPTIPYWV